MLRDWYWLMPNEVLYNKELTDKQKLLFCAISNLCAEKWYCRASNEYIWELLNADKWTISKNIAKLHDKWFINIEIENWCQRKITLAENNIPLVKNDKGGSQKWLGGVVKNDNIILQENNTTNKEKLKRKYLDFVYLSDEEYKKIADRYGERVLKDFIERVDNRVWEKPNSKDRKNRDHYRTILQRIQRAWIKEIPKSNRNESWVYDLPF